MSYSKGQSLIEAVITLFLMLLAVFINLEAVRRSHMEVLLHHGAFIFARNRALGLGCEAARHGVSLFLQEALGSHAGISFARKIDFCERRERKGLVGLLHFRYPTLIRFSGWHHGKDCFKHHFELTKACIFPF